MSILKQSNITIVEESPALPTKPTHYSQIDLYTLVSAKIDSIQDELIEIGCDIPADFVFLVEALGGIVDLETGMVQSA